MKLNLITNVPEQYNRMGSAASKFGNANHGAMSQAQKDIQGFGQLVKGFVVGNLVYDSFRKVGNIVSGSVNQFIDLDKSAHFAATRLDEVSSGAMKFGDALKQIKDISNVVGAKSIFNSAEVASAANEFAAAGFSLAQIQQVLMPQTKFATLASMNLSESVLTLSGSMNSFNLISKDAVMTGKNYAMAIDMMSYAADKSTTTVAEIGNAVKYGGTVWGKTNQDMKTFLAFTMSLSKVNIKGEQAGERLRTIMARMTEPTEEIKKRFAEINFSAMDPKTGKFRDMISIMDELREKTDKLGFKKTQWVTETFGTESLAAMLELLSPAGKQIATFYDSIGNSAGSADKKIGDVSQSLSFKLENLKGAFETKLFTGMESGRSPIALLIDDAISAIDKFDMTKINAFISANLPQVIGLLSESFRIIAPIATDLMKVLALTLEILLFYSPILTPLVGLYLKWKILTYAIAGYQALLAFTTGILNSALVYELRFIGLLIAEEGILSGVTYGLSTAFGVLWTAITGPVGIVIAILAGIGLAIFTIAKNWDSWGNGITKFHEKFKLFFYIASPLLGVFIDIMNRWDMIKQAFTDGGMIAGIKALGGVIMGSLLDPVYMVAEMLNKIGLLSDKNFEQFRLFKAGISGDLHDRVPMIMGTTTPTPENSKYGSLPIKTATTFYGQEQPVFTPDYGQTAQTLPTPVTSSNQVGVNINVSSEKGLATSTGVTGSTAVNTNMGVSK